MFALLCLFLSLLPTIAPAFNLDEQSVLIHKGPSGTYFGFSVSQHRDRGASWLLIGAPLAKTDQPGVDKGGAVYKCSADRSNACQQILFDRKGSNYEKIDGKLEQIDDKSHQWFGANVDSSGETGLIVACAPRYVYFSTSRKLREPTGTCYLSTGSFTGFFELSPCRNDFYGYNRQGSCQAGFSAKLSRNGRRLFLGGIGSYYWQGQVFSTDLLLNQTFEAPKKEGPEVDDNTYLGYSMTVGNFNGSIATSDIAVGMPRANNLMGKVALFSATLENLVNITGEQIGSYFGYSLTTTDINGDGMDDIIIGAPLYSFLNAKDSSFENGQIYVAYQDKHHDFEIRTRIEGMRSRARFGLSMTSIGDLNKDGYQDIAVGSPYDGKKTSAGAVYIFTGGRNGLNEKPSQVIYGEYFDPDLKTFGFALDGGMDVDKNMYPDLLVGAYASDVVLHFKGRPVVNVSASLTVEPQNINLEDKGCSLVDTTKVPCVVISICLQFSGVGVNRDLSMTYTTKLDIDTNRAPRMFFLNKETQNEDQVTIGLRKETKYCKSTYAYLTSDVRDRFTSMTIEVGFNIFDPWPERRFVKPILNQAFPNFLRHTIKVQQDCGKDNICIPNLQLNVNPNMDQYVVGSKRRLSVHINVTNAAEDAFDAMLYVYMPLESINFVNIDRSQLDFPVTCTGAQPDRTGLNVLVCHVGNPFPANKTISFSVLLEPSKKMTSIPDYTFIVIVNSSNPELPQDVEDNKAVVGVPVKVQVKPIIFGVTKPHLVIYDMEGKKSAEKATPVSVHGIGEKVVHVYQLLNRGPSVITRAEVIILWPTKTLHGEFILYLLEQPQVSGNATCLPLGLDQVNPLRLPLIDDRMGRREKRHGENPVELFQDNDHVHLPLDQLTSCGTTLCTKIECYVSHLGKGESVLFTLKSRLWKATVTTFGVNRFHISSKLIASVTRLPYNLDPHYLPPEVYSITTSVTVIGLTRSPLIPLPLLLFSILAGFALLGCVVLVFRKVGFFKRTKFTLLVHVETQPLFTYSNEQNFSLSSSSTASLSSSKKQT